MTLAETLLSKLGEPRPSSPGRFVLAHADEVSGWSVAVTIEKAGPPGNTALILRPPGTPPPHCSIKLRIVTPIGISYTPGRLTAPLNENIIVPGHRSVPTCVNHVAPL